MKAFLIIFLMIGFLWNAGVFAQGFDEVLVTSHNLSVGGGDSLIRDVCLVCHVEPVSAVSPQVVEALPMGLQAEEPDLGDEFLNQPLAPLSDPDAFRPLWDSNYTTDFFLPLPEMEPLVGKGEPDKRPFGPSFHCLTCHDGALGTDVHQRGFSAGGEGDRIREMITVKEDSRLLDHPDSVIYPRKTTGEFSAKSANPNLKRYWSIPDRDINGVIIPTGPNSVSLGLMNIEPDNALQATGLVRTFFGVIHCDSCHNPHLDQNRPFLRVPTHDLCLVCHQR
jgi:predicted CXXCH cytochrome family protein